MQAVVLALQNGFDVGFRRESGDVFVRIRRAGSGWSKIGRVRGIRDMPEYELGEQLDLTIEKILGVQGLEDDDDYCV